MADPLAQRLSITSLAALPACAATTTTTTTSAAAGTAGDMRVLIREALQEWEQPGTVAAEGGGEVRPWRACPELPQHAATSGLHIAASIASPISAPIHMHTISQHTRAHTHTHANTYTHTQNAHTQLRLMVFRVPHCCTFHGRALPANCALCSLHLPALFHKHIQITEGGGTSAMARI